MSLEGYRSQQTGFSPFSIQPYCQTDEKFTHCHRYKTKYLSLRQSIRAFLCDGPMYVLICVKISILTYYTVLYGSLGR